MPLATTPRRIAQMLVDCDQSIVASYDFTQESIDQLERPSWLVFIEDASFQNTTVDQELMEQGYSIAYIGQVFNSGYSDYTREYEILARRVAENSVRYLLEHPYLQLSNTRGLFPERLGGLIGVQRMTVNNRSAVTLFSRDGVEGQAFWGFTIDITVVEQIAYNTVGF